MFCEKAARERKTFCERLPKIAAHARKTGRPEEAMLAIVTEPDGRVGARLAAELGLVAGRDALLSRAERTAPAQVEKVRVLGVGRLRPPKRQRLRDHPRGPRTPPAAPTNEKTTPRLTTVPIMHPPPVAVFSVAPAQV